MDAGSLGSVAQLGLRFSDESTGSDALIRDQHNFAPARHARRSAPEAAAFSPRDCRPCEPRRTTSADGSTATLTYRRQERTALYIQTQEGDIVRLNIKVRDAATATANVTTDGETQLAELSVSARSSIKISFHVEGDLNADELAAIRSVVEQAGALAEDFFAGDLPAAFAAAAQLNVDGAELAKVGLRLSAREQITYSGLAALPTRAAPPAAAAPPRAAAAVPVTDVVATVDDAPEPADTAAPAATETPAAPDETLSAPVETPPAAAAPASVAGQALGMIANFVQQLLDTLRTPPAPAQDAGATPSLNVSLKLRIFQATVINLAATQQPPSTADGGDAAATGMPLVADTLEALAATEEPPLDLNA